MKVLFCLHHPGAFRSFDEVVRLLCARGHQVTLLHGQEEKATALHRAIEAFPAEVDGFVTGPLRLRRKWRRLANIRELVNCLNYLRPGHPNPHLVKRFAPSVQNPLRKWMRKALKKPGSRKLIATAFLRHSLKTLEGYIPPDAGISRWLQQNRPDIVIASPLIFPDSKELEYVKAAQGLGIPTVGVVLSWDNLTTKGTFHILPDLTLVWNHALLDEAVLLHDVPRDGISVSGAPTFDFWFGMEASVDFPRFAQRLGIDPTKPVVLYLCSSHFISENENLLLSKLVKALNADPTTGNLSLVVRPHPLNTAIWEGFRAEGVVLWPSRGEWVDMPSAKQAYYDTIFHSQAVIGVNTSAFLEAAILDKPCITVITPDSQSKQSGLGHFQHLINGGFLEVATDYAEAASRIGAILGGRDSRKNQRQQFVREFIRPRGLKIPASRIIAEVIEALGTGQAPLRTSN